MPVGRIRRGGVKKLAIRPRDYWIEDVKPFIAVISAATLIISFIVGAYLCFGLMPAFATAFILIVVALLAIALS